MNYVKINSVGQIEKYPYTFTDLRNDFPHTSFPMPLEENTLVGLNIFYVSATDQPSGDHTKNVVEDNPVVENGKWVQSWKIVNATQEEIKVKHETASNNIRKIRGELLNSSDWTQLADSPADKQAWASYRQALRDISSQPNFPWSVEWPVAPS